MIFYLNALIKSILLFMLKLALRSKQSIFLLSILFFSFLIFLFPLSFSSTFLLQSQPERLPSPTDRDIHGCPGCSTPMGWSIDVKKVRNRQLKPVAVANTVDRDILFDSYCTFFFNFHFPLFTFYFLHFNFHFCFSFFNFFLLFNSFFIFYKSFVFSFQ